MNRVLRILLLILFLFGGLETGGLAALEEKGTGKAGECLHKAFEAARTVKDRVTKAGLLEEIGQDMACAGDIAGARQAVAETDHAKGAAMIGEGAASADFKQVYGELAARRV